MQARSPQRRRADVVSRVHIRAGTNEAIDLDQIIVVRGPVERRRAVTGGGFLRMRRYGKQHRTQRPQRTQRTPCTRCTHYSASVSSCTLPVLPPMRSTGTSILSISVISKLAIDGLSV